MPKKIDDELLIKFKSINKQKNKGNTKMTLKSKLTKLKIQENLSKVVARRKEQERKDRRKKFLDEGRQTALKAQRAKLGRTASTPMYKAPVKAKPKAKPKAKASGTARNHLQGIQLGFYVKHRGDIGKHGDTFRVLKNNAKTILGKSTKTGEERKISKMNLISTYPPSPKTRPPPLRKAVRKATTTSAIRNMGTDIGGRIRAVQKERATTEKKYATKHNKIIKDRIDVSDYLGTSKMDDSIAHQKKTYKVLKIGSVVSLRLSLGSPESPMRGSEGGTKFRVEKIGAWDRQMGAKNTWFHGRSMKNSKLYKIQKSFVK